MNNQTTTPIRFDGKASEYFGIWIVNLLLTLLTLGIYSAWAKVRRKKYFYNNTFIDGVGFDYHAKPIAILKGRIIAFILFAAYAFGGRISPFLPLLAMLIFFIALPWLVVRASTFNARNTSHRGLRFDFVGRVGEAARIFIVLPITIIFTLGLIVPFISHQKMKFLVNGHRFGLSQFDMQAKVRSFYKIYLVVFIVPFIGIVAAIALPAYKGYVDKSKAKAAEEQHSAIAAPLNLAFVNAPQAMTVIENTVTAANQGAGDTQAESTADVTENSLAVDQVAEETDPYDVPMAEPEHEKTFEEMMAERQKAKEENFKNMFKHPAALGAFFGGMLVYLFFIFLFAAYLQSRIGNLVWNNTKLDNLSFKCTLRARSLFGLYLSNMLMILLTFGLATPWAQIRLARYRLENLAIVGDVNFDQFVGDKKAETKATGEEIADFFDVDLSFG